MTGSYEIGKAQRWVDALKAKGHTPQEEDEFFGEGPDTRTEAQRLDVFAVAHDHCNGPRCTACGWGTCWHCHDIDVIPECSARVAKCDLCNDDCYGCPCPCHQEARS